MTDLPAESGGKPARLTRRSDFQKAYRNGRRWNGRWVNLFSRTRSADEGGEAVRGGITVTKKSGNAVRRNRLRRQIREILREALPALVSGKDGMDFVIHVRPGKVEIEYADLRREIRSLLKRGLRATAGAPPRGAEPVSGQSPRN